MTEPELVTRYDPGWPATGTGARRASLSTELGLLHQAVLARFLGQGRAPTARWLDQQARRLGLEPSAARTALAAADLVHLNAGQVTVAYPFSGVPTGHRVQPGGSPPVWAMCAIDALGIPQMAGRDAVIDATDPHSGDRIRVELAGQRWRWDPPQTAVLIARTGSAGCVAQCFCPHVNFVTSPEHARGYLADHPQLTGQLLPQPVAVEYAQAVFGRLLMTRG